MSNEKIKGYFCIESPEIEKEFYKYPSDEDFPKLNYTDVVGGHGTKSMI